MKSSNTPESKNRKRKLALFSLEANLKTYQAGKLPNGDNASKEHCQTQIERINKEIVTLKSRIVG